jgi:hypothetical protein
LVFRRVFRRVFRLVFRLIVRLIRTGVRMCHETVPRPSVVSAC